MQASRDRPGESHPGYRGAGGAAGEWLAAWAAQQRDNLEDAQPEPAEGMSGRAEQIWEPLLAIADAAGGDWPERARAACAELTLANGVPDSEEDSGDPFAAFMADFDADMAGL